MVKQSYYQSIILLANLATKIDLPMFVQDVVVGEEEEPKAIDLNDIRDLRVIVWYDEETGNGRDAKYELLADGVVRTSLPIRKEDMSERVLISGVYGDIQFEAIVAIKHVEYGASEIELTPYVLRNATGAGGGEGGMQQYILGYADGHITHNGVALTFAEVKAAVEDTSKFVYLEFANALHLPCFIVDSEGNSAVAFSAAFQVDGAPYIERVAINEQGDVKIDNMRCVHFSNNNSVVIGSNTTASGSYSHAEGRDTTAIGSYSHAEGRDTIASGIASHAEGQGTTTSGLYSHVEGRYNDFNDFANQLGAFVHGCGTKTSDRANAFAIAQDGKIYVIGLGGYDGKNHTQALSLQELLGLSNIQASTNVRVNNYDVPQLTAEQVTQAYNAIVAGRNITITDATGNYHLGVTQADLLNGDIAISLIFLNVMLLTYEISGSSVEIQFKNL